MPLDKSIRKFSGGEVYFWIEQGSSIHLKAVSGTDPVELSSKETREIAKALLDLAVELEALDKT
ncbi:MAG: hypothetical protein EXS18_02890 [Verrucomicrobiae bacterium]|nr:hypothetical protein [Verrucomicrobiae bacterium]